MMEEKQPLPPPAIPDMRQKLNQIVETHEGIAMAAQVLLAISNDKAERARLMSEYKYVVDHQSKMVLAKRKGEAIG
jgi:hypothetical protein